MLGYVGPCMQVVWLICSLTDKLVHPRKMSHFYFREQHYLSRPHPPPFPVPLNDLISHVVTYLTTYMYIQIRYVCPSSCSRCPLFRVDSRFPHHPSDRPASASHTLMRKAASGLNGLPKTDYRSFVSFLPHTSIHRP